MKFIKEITPKGLLLPVTAARLAGFEANEKAEYHALDGAMVVLKGQMTAMELVDAIHSLKDLASDLLVRLAKVCGSCQHCGDECPYAEDETRVRLSGGVLEQAGLPGDARLDMRIGDREVVLSEAEGFDLRDVPPEMKALFRQTNICLGELDGLLAGGDIVYGG